MPSGTGTSSHTTLQCHGAPRCPQPHPPSGCSPLTSVSSCRGAMLPTGTPSPQQQQPHTVTGKQWASHLGGLCATPALPTVTPPALRAAPALPTVTPPALRAAPALPTVTPPALRAVGRTGSGMGRVSCQQGPLERGSREVPGGSQVWLGGRALRGDSSPAVGTNTQHCLLLAMAECTQLQTPTTTPSAPPPPTASAPW